MCGVWGMVNPHKNHIQGDKMSNEKREVTEKVSVAEPTDLMYSKDSAKFDEMVEVSKRLRSGLEDYLQDDANQLEIRRGILAEMDKAIKDYTSGKNPYGSYIFHHNVKKAGKFYQRLIIRDAAYFQMIRNALKAHDETDSDFAVPNFDMLRDYDRDKNGNIVKKDEFTQMEVQMELMAPLLYKILPSGWNECLPDEPEIQEAKKLGLQSATSTPQHCIIVWGSNARFWG